MNSAFTIYDVYGLTEIPPSDENQVTNGSADSLLKMQRFRRRVKEKGQSDMAPKNRKKKEKAHGKLFFCF